MRAQRFVVLHNPLPSSAPFRRNDANMPAAFDQTSPTDGLYLFSILHCRPLHYLLKNSEWTNRNSSLVHRTTRRRPVPVAFDVGASEAPHGIYSLDGPTCEKWVRVRERDLGVDDVFEDSDPIVICTVLFRPIVHKL